MGLQEIRSKHVQLILLLSLQISIGLIQNPTFLFNTQNNELIKVEENNEDKQKRFEDYIKPSGFWIQDPIFINAGAIGVGAHNWTWVENQSWFGGGNGTKVNPYRIENLTINGNNSANCLEIYGSNVYFIIRNITAFNSSSSTYNGAIKLTYTSNGILEENICSFNNAPGIMLFHSDFNQIINNTVYNNSNLGIRLHYSSNNTLIKNNAKFQSTGIYNQYSNNNTYLNNTINSNTNNGMYFEQCSFNNLTYNTASFNSNYGIDVRDFYNNNIINNDVIFNGGSGIRVRYSDNNTIIYNNASFNSGTGITLHSSNFNNISWNTADFDNIGFQISSSFNNTLKDNHADFSSVMGISFDHSNNCSAIENILINNAQGGFLCYQSQD